MSPVTTVEKIALFPPSLSLFAVLSALKMFFFASRPPCIAIRGPPPLSDYERPKNKTEAGRTHVVVRGIEVLTAEGVTRNFMRPYAVRTSWYFPSFLLFSVPRNSVGRGCGCEGSFHFPQTEMSPFPSLLSSLLVRLPNG